MTEAYPQGLPYSGYPQGVPYAPVAQPAPDEPAPPAAEPEPAPSNPIVVTPAAVSTGRREGDVATVTPA